MDDARLVEYERCLVGACKTSPGVMDAYGVVPEDMRDLAGATVLRAIRTIVDSGRVVDDLTLVDEVRGKGVPISYVTDLPATTVANAAFYVEKVREAAAKRRIEVFAATAKEVAERADLDSREQMDFLERALSAVTDKSRSATVWLKDILKPAVEDLVYRAQNPAGYSGIQSGYPAIDVLTDGFQAGELIIIAARPSLGKTALAVTLAVNISVRGGVVSGFFSSEMSELLIGQRFLANAGRFQLDRVRSGLLKTTDYSRITEAASEMYHEQVLINSTPNIKLADLRGAARAMVRRGAKILFVDYLTLIQHGDPRTPRHERVGEISKSLKGLARELSVPVVALSQLARTAEGKKPSLSELRQSGEIEEDADVVMLLHRERDQAAEAVPTVVILAKNRNGPVGEVRMVFHPATGRFELEEVER